MTGVCRPDPTSLVLDLTRRLAEEFHSVPLPAVTRAVQGAVRAAALFGDDVRDSLDTIERIAREDLTAVRDAAADRRPAVTG